MPRILAAIAAFFMSALTVLFISHAYAGEKYMPNSVGGYVVLTDEPCQMPVIKEEYKNRAYATDSSGDKREGCWYRPEAEKPFVPRVVVLMYEEGSPNVGSFDQRLFSDEMKQWEEYPIPHPELEFKGEI